MSLQARIAVWTCAGLLVACLVAAPLTAQPAGGDRRGGAQDGRGQFDREAMQQRFSEMMRERLGATEEEWQVLGPRVEKVMTLRRDAMMRGGFGGFGGRRGGPGAQGGPGGDAGNQPEQPPVATAAANLRTVLEDENAEPAKIKAAMAALRDARTKAEQELAQAQTELRELLSLRQEATLLSMGMLD